jgi:hypothetical protein
MATVTRRDFKTSLPQPSTCKKSQVNEADYIRNGSWPRQTFNCDRTKSCLASLHTPPNSLTTKTFSPTPTSNNIHTTYIHSSLGSSTAVLNNNLPTPLVSDVRVSQSQHASTPTEKRTSHHIAPTPRRLLRIFTMRTSNA